MMIDDTDLFAERLAHELCLIANSALDLDIENLCGVHRFMEELSKKIDDVIWDRIADDLRRRGWRRA